VFDRYTEKARRVIFFARYEASAFGTRYIATEHVLLGLLREDGQLKRELAVKGASYDTIRARVEAQAAQGEKISTSVDLPLNQECQRALSYAAEESERLTHKVIAPGHLVLGLLREKGSLAAALLRESGIDLALYREVVRREPAEPVERPHPVAAYEPAEPVETPAPAAAQLAAPIASLAKLAELELTNLEPDQRLKRKQWSRREAMGRMIDLATAEHQWLARALSEPKLTVPVYPQEEWVTAQHYADCSWTDLLNLWSSINRLLIHVLAVVPEEKLTAECRIGVEEPQTLLAVIQRYVSECEDVAGQILARLD